MARIILVPCGTVNCYILAGESGAVLVDTGLKAHRARVLEKARQYGVRCILLTHGHWDHIQNAAYLAQELGVPVCLNRQDTLLAQDNRLSLMVPRGFRGKVLNFLSKASLSGETLTPFPAEPLEDGELLIKYGVDARVMALPGHTKGSVGILFDEGAQLIAGDAVMNFFSPTPALIADEPERAEQTAKLLKNSKIQTIYPGHGRPFSPKKLP